MDLESERARRIASALAGKPALPPVGRLLAAAALLAAAFAAAADEAAVRRVVQEQMRRGATIESVQKAPWGDLYEVVVRGPDGPLVYYVDGRASVIITGSAIDAKTGRNLTEERQRKLDAIKWESLPLQWAITTVRGSGRRKIAILSDPNCPYCKRLEEDLAKVDDITVHILPYAILSPASVRQAKAVWCSKDRARVWDDLMFRRIEPRPERDCDTPVEKLQDYGRRIGARATPTWFLESGDRYSGALPFDEIRRLAGRGVTRQALMKTIFVVVVVAAFAAFSWYLFPSPPLADPAILEGLTPGDKVKFRVDAIGGAFTMMSIARAI